MLRRHMELEDKAVGIRKGGRRKRGRRASGSRSNGMSGTLHQPPCVTYLVRPCSITCKQPLSLPHLYPIYSSPGLLHGLFFSLRLIWFSCMETRLALKRRVLCSSVIIPCYTHLTLKTKTKVHKFISPKICSFLLPIFSLPWLDLAKKSGVCGNKWGRENKLNFVFLIRELEDTPSKDGTGNF